MREVGTLTVIASGKTPVQPRMTNIEYYYAGEGGGTAMGLYDPATGVLLEAYGERPKVGPCCGWTWR